jgi:polyhydroxybutyrate depolymerase
MHGLMKLIAQAVVVSAAIAATPTLAAKEAVPSALRFRLLSSAWDRPQPSPLQPRQSALITHSLVHDGMVRSYDLFVPANAGSRPLPVVFVFHGGYGTPEQAEKITRMQELASQVGVIVAFPAAAGEGQQWNDGRDYTAGGPDDIAFVDALIEDIAATYAVDRQRLFATGLSNGGMFTLRLACERSDTFRAFAPVIASFPVDYVDRCAPARAVPIAFIHGTSDALMPFAGGPITEGKGDSSTDRGEVISAPATVAFWAEANGCWPDPVQQMLPDLVRRDGTRVERFTFVDCPFGADVVHYQVIGGGHTWPGSTPLPPGNRFGRVSRDIDATSEIWGFFNAH